MYEAILSRNKNYIIQSKNEVILEGLVKDIRKECEQYHNVEVTFVSGRADTTGLKIWLDV